MSYIYFDCYAGFDVQLALGSLIDMTKDTAIADSTIKCLIKDAYIYTEETKRQSMEGTLAYFDFCVTDETPIPQIIEKSLLDDDFKAMLKRWYKLKSDGKRYHFYDELNELLFCAASLAIIRDLGADSVYVSAMYQGNGTIATENSITVIPSPHTELISKMAGLSVIPCDIEKEILTPGGIGFLYVLSAKHMPPKAHNIIQSGYGAGEENIKLPNVARCILADESDKELSLNLEELLSDVYTEFGVMAESNK